MEFGASDDLALETPFPGVSRRTFHSDQSTVVSYSFEPGASFPLHVHQQEQITIIEEGSVEFSAAGTTRWLSAGAWSVVEGGIEHGIRAGADGARFLAILVPRRGDQDSYTIVQPIANQERV